MTENAFGSEPLLTLEPFLEAVREGLEAEGWDISGLQKTTSYEFEGRWAGDSSRSAYLFFHRPGLGDWASIDVFLDETSKGLKGNLALVLDGPVLEGIPDPGEALARFRGIAKAALPPGYRTPITLRYRLPGVRANPLEADTEIRFKIQLPRTTMDAGASAVSTLSRGAAQAFFGVLQSPDLVGFLPD